MANPSTAARCAPGVLLIGRYRLLRQIGEGAMGTVWAATDEVTTREVALKLLIRPDPEHRQRLLREARACGALKNRHIIDVFDILETEDGEPFLVMELLHGESLAEQLERRRRVEPEEAARIGRDVARALGAAHALHIIHRDLKPANIFLHLEPDNDRYVVKVLDFGISKNLAAVDALNTVAGGAVGSPFYMSPEQVRGDVAIDHRADIWALGVVLFEILTGVRPFQGETAEVFAHILTSDAPSVTRYIRQIDEGFAQIIARCLTRDRDARFSSAAEVAALLDRHAGAAASWSGPRARTSNPRPSMAGAVVSDRDDVDDEAATLFYQPSQIRASAASLPEAAPPDAWGAGGTVRMDPEAAGAYGAPQNAPPQAQPPYAVPGAPPPGYGAHPIYGPPPGHAPAPPGYAAHTAGAYAPSAGRPFGPSADHYPPPPPPMSSGAMPPPSIPSIPGFPGAPGSAVTPLVRAPEGPPLSAAAPVLTADEIPDFRRPTRSTLIALLVGLVIALGIITVSLIMVLVESDESTPAASTAEPASTEVAATPPPSATEAATAAPEPTASASAPPTATPTATATVAAAPTRTAPAPTRPPTRPVKRDCSKLKLLQRQRCERGR